MNIVLWILQILLAVVYLWHGQLHAGTARRDARGDGREYEREPAGFYRHRRSAGGDWADICRRSLASCPG